MVMSREIKKTSSSIAMLQERFRQLEKVKEMREERELLNLITTTSLSSSSTSSNIHIHNNNLHQSNAYSSSYYYYDHGLQYYSSITSNNLYDQLDTSKLFFQSKIIFPNQPSCLDSTQLLPLSLSLSCPNSQILQKKHNAAACCWDDPQTKPSNWLMDIPLAASSSSPSLTKRISDHQSTHVSSDVDTTLHL